MSADISKTSKQRCLLYPDYLCFDTQPASQKHHSVAYTVHIICSLAASEACYGCVTESSLLSRVENTCRLYTMFGQRSQDESRLCAQKQACAWFECTKAAELNNRGEEQRRQLWSLTFIASVDNQGSLVKGPKVFEALSLQTGICGSFHSGDSAIPS